MKKASKISSAERSEIEILHTKGYSARAIAIALGHSPNSIAAELRRNSYQDGSYVAAKLAKHWNPAEISGYTKDHPELGFCVSKTAIYEWLYSAWGQTYCQYLYSQRYRHKPRRPNKAKRQMILNRLPVAKRPAAAHERVLQTGHWEYDPSSVQSALGAATHWPLLSKDRLDW